MGMCVTGIWFVYKILSSITPTSVKEQIKKYLSLNNNPRSSTFGFISSILIVIICLYIFGVNFSITPVILNQLKIKQPIGWVIDSMNSEDLNNELIELKKEIQIMEKSLRDIEGLSINELRSRFKYILEYSLRLRVQSLEQSQRLEDLIQYTSAELAKAKAAKILAEQTGTLSVDQLKATDTKNQSTTSFWMGALAGIPIGIGCSLTAVFISRRKNNI